MADSDRSRSRAPLSVDEAGDQIRTQRFTGRTTTAISNKAKMIAALRREQAKILAEGRVLEGALPPINDQMSPSDILNAQRSINRALGRPADHDFTGSQGNNSDSRTARRAAGGGVITSNDTPGAARVPQTVRDTGEFMGPSQELMGPFPKSASPEQIAAQDPNNPNPNAPLLGDEARPAQPAQVAGAPGNPLLDQMVRDGTLPQGANFERTGAGLQTRVMSESGERNVMIQPTGAQALEGKFGAVAQQQFGKPWGQLDPGQRKMILRANPVARTRGEVLANGQGKFNTRGERFMNVAGSEFTPGGGTIREVDPSQAHDLTRIKAGDSLLPRNALAGLLAPEQYADASGNRVAYVTRGAPDTGEPKPAVPAPQGTPAPAPQPAPAPAPGGVKPPIKMPVDPASLAQTTPVAPAQAPAAAAPAAAPNNPLATLQPAAPAPKAVVTPQDAQAAMGQIHASPIMQGVRELGVGGPLGSVADMALNSPAVASVVSDVATAAQPENWGKQTLRPMPNLKDAATTAVNNTVEKAQQFASGLPKQQIQPSGGEGMLGGAAKKARSAFAGIKETLLPSGNTIPGRTPAAPVAPQIPPPQQPAPSPVVNAAPPTPAAAPVASTGKPGFFDDNGPAHRAFDAVGLAKYPAVSAPAASTQPAAPVVQPPPKTPPPMDDPKKKRNPLLNIATS